jgi:RimJ/RimL family protein N-acetyltransferase
MLVEAGERSISTEQQKIRIQNVKRNENSTILVAEIDNKLVGYLLAMGGTARKTKHSVYIVIGILKNFRGQGIGTKLFENLEDWAFNQNVHRLELTTVMHNLAGVALYKKMGFVIEGTKKDSLFIAGEYVDEYYMAKILPIKN